MRIFNNDKTAELNGYDAEKGYLRKHRIFKAHHEATEAEVGKWHYETVAEYSGGGKDVKKVWDVEPREAQEAYDEYEEIFVYEKYTREELENILRTKRMPLLDAFDKWEKAVIRGRETESEAVMAWYKDLLDLSENAIAEIPERVRYYL